MSDLRELERASEGGAPPAPIDSPAAWKVADFASPADYTLEFSRAQLREIADATARVKAGGLGLDGLRREHFPLPSLEPLFAEMRDRLKDGCGFLVLRRLPVEEYSKDELGLVFYEDAFVACEAYGHELSGSAPRLNGCVGWTPRTDEVVAASNGAAKVLTSNRNLLVIADVLAVNKGFAKAQPELVRGLVHGVLEGNRRLRDEPAAHLGVVAKAFGWTEEEARDELALALAR